MKANQHDEYVQEEGSFYAKNEETGEEMLYFEAEDINLVFRSMLEEDIEEIAKLKRLNSRMKKGLLKRLQKENSQNYHFVIEERLTFQEDGRRKLVAITEMIGTKTETIIETNHIKQAEYTRFISSRVKAILEDFYKKINETPDMLIYSIE